MISVIIPAFREGRGVERAIDEVDAVLAAFAEGGEILVVDDGSPDDTYARAMAKTRTVAKLRVLRHPANAGPGAAFRTGFQASRGDKVVTIDCDLSFDPNQIPRVVEALGDADVVVGAQHGRGAEVVNVPWLRLACSQVAYWMDRAIVGGGLSSYSSFFVAYRGSLIRNTEFNANGFDAQCEILARLVRRGARIKSVPARLVWRDRRRVSSMNLLREARRRIWVWWRFNRIWGGSVLSHEVRRSARI
jgi:dolichol-phosphate mannosyltransferase